MVNTVRCVGAALVLFVVCSLNDNVDCVTIETAYAGREGSRDVREISDQNRLKIAHTVITRSAFYNKARHAHTRHRRSHTNGGWLTCETCGGGKWTTMKMMKPIIWCLNSDHADQDGRNDD